MKTAPFVATVLAFGLLAVSPARPQTAAPRMVEVGGHKLRTLVEGTGQEGRPTVVLVGGLGDPLEIWKSVQPRIAQEKLLFQLRFWVPDVPVVPV